MSSATLSYTSGDPRRLSAKQRGGTSASSLAADAAIRDFKNDRRNRNRGEDGTGRVSALGRGVGEFAANVSATVDSFGVPRWIVRALVLTGVGIVLAAAVLNVDWVSRYSIAGTALLDGKPLGRVALVFHAVDGKPGDEQFSQSVFTREDGSFRNDPTVGLPAGTYAVVIEGARTGRTVGRKGVAGMPAAQVPQRYRDRSTTPLRFTITGNTTGLQVVARNR
jgi:hypothetical protein